LITLRLLLLSLLVVLLLLLLAVSIVMHPQSDGGPNSVR
jgi:hypothetical protein